MSDDDADRRYDRMIRRLVRLSVEVGHPISDPNPFPRFRIWRWWP